MNLAVDASITRGVQVLRNRMYADAWTGRSWLSIDYSASCILVLRAALRGGAR